MANEIILDPLSHAVIYSPMNYFNAKYSSFLAVSNLMRNQTCQIFDGRKCEPEGGIVSSKCEPEGGIVSSKCEPGG